MPRFIASIAILALSTTAVAAAAKPPPPKPPEQVLIDGLHAMASAITTDGNSQQASASSQSATPQAQPTGDHDQGDDHASDVAILKVCNHDNPSAQRSAICPQPNSPP